MDITSLLNNHDVEPRNAVFVGTNHHVRGPYRSYRWVKKLAIVDISDAVGTKHAAEISKIP